MRPGPVVCVGEALIDMLASQPGVSVGDAPGFVKAPGGAPANLAVGLARLGVATAFVGRVGDDPFGHFLAGTLAANGVGVDHLVFDKRARTALAFVSLDAEHRPDYLFYRHPSADQMLTPEDVRVPAASAAILCAGSVLLSAEPSGGALVAALTAAREAGALVAFDLNLRPQLFESEEVLRRAVRRVLPMVHVAKCNEEELAFVTGESDPVRGAAALAARGPELVVVTRGPSGALAHTRSGAVCAEGFAVDVVDTTGAGDSFMAALVAGLVRLRTSPATIGVIALDALRELLVTANAAGALATTGVGAIPSLPTRASLAAFLRRHVVGNLAARL